MHKNNYFEAYVTSDRGEQLRKKWGYLIPSESVDCPLCDSKQSSKMYSLVIADAVLCDMCGFKYVSNRMSDLQSKEYYEKGYEEEVFKKDFEGIVHDIYGDPIERKKKIKDRCREIELTRKHCSTGKVLDIGCGTGLYYEGLGDEYEFYGIELSESAADYTKGRFPAKIFSKPVEKCEFDSDYFDVINMTYIIEHLGDPTSVMLQVKKWLKPGGLLLISSPNWNSPMSLLFKEFFRLNDPLQHINLWDSKSLKKYVMGLGFKVNKIYYPYFSTEYFNRKEVIRVFKNSLLIIILRALYKARIMITPRIDKILSPPFIGNIMIVEAYK